MCEIHAGFPRFSMKKKEYKYNILILYRLRVEMIILRIYWLKENIIKISVILKTFNVVIRKFKVIYLACSWLSVYFYLTVLLKKITAGSGRQDLLV